MSTAPGAAGSASRRGEEPYPDRGGTGGVVGAASRRRLKYLASINDDVLGEDTDPDFEMEYIDVGNVDSSGRVSELASYRFEDAPSRARRRVRDGDVIISTVRTYLQAITQIREPSDNLVVSTGFAVVRPRPDRFDARYCRFALREPAFLAEVERRSVGVSYPAINATDLADIPISVHPLQTQRAIADHLDRETARIDALVAAKQRLLTLLAEKRRAIIARAVTRGLDPRVPLRDSGVPWLGEIPAHWKRCHLKRVLSAVDYGISALVDTSGEIAVLRMGDIQDGEIDYSNVGFVEEADDALLLQPGDVVFNRTNSLDRIGKVALFRGASAYPVSFASYLVRLRCNDAALPEFLVWLLNSIPVLAWARAEAMPAIGQANLNPHRYGYLPVAIPPLAEQRAIVGFLESECEKLNVLRAESVRTIGLLKERRSALIAAAVTGRLDVGSAS